MINFKINWLFFAITLIVTGLMLALFITLSDNTGYAIATPLFVMFPLLHCLAVSFDGSPRMSINVKNLSSLFAIILLIIGILASIFDFKIVVYISLMVCFFLIWLGLTFLLVIHTKG